MKLDDADLDLVLASVGRHLVLDEEMAPAAAGRRAPHRRLLVVAAVIVVLVVLAIAIAPVRRTVAGWLGLGSTTIVRVPVTTPTTVPLPAISAGLRTIDPAEAAQRIGRPLPNAAATELGEPQRIAAMPEGGVVLVWSDGGTTLWIHDSDLPSIQLLKKLISAGQEVRSIDHLGDGALAVTGDHILVTPHRTIAAGTVVLWTDAGLELRLESNLPLDTMVRIARQLPIPPPS
jgi:hypothetical protein